jgi:hypothetical protein
MGALMLLTRAVTDYFKQLKFGETASVFPRRPCALATASAPYFDKQSFSDSSRIIYRPPYTSNISSIEKKICCSSFPKLQ